jgi:hypothetical protein
MVSNTFPVTSFSVGSSAVPEGRAAETGCDLPKVPEPPADSLQRQRYPFTLQPQEHCARFVLHAGARLRLFIRSR